MGQIDWQGIQPIRITVELNRIPRPRPSHRPAQHRHSIPPTMAAIHRNTSKVTTFSFRLATKYYNWSLEYEYPLALTYIKLTGVFLDLLSKGAIKSPNWSGFQRSFNCLALGMFQRMMEKFKIGDTLGNFVEEQAKEIKSEYKKLLASY